MVRNWSFNCTVKPLLLYSKNYVLVFEYWIFLTQKQVCSNCELLQIPWLFFYFIFCTKKLFHFKNKYIFSYFLFDIFPLNIISLDFCTVYFMHLNTKTNSLYMQRHGCKLNILIYCKYDKILINSAALVCTTLSRSVNMSM